MLYAGIGTMSFTRRGFLQSVVAAAAMFTLPSCAGMPADVYKRPIRKHGFAVMAGSRLAPGGSIGPFVERGGKLLRRALLQSARKRLDYCFMLGNMIENSSLEGRGFDLLALAVRETP